ncbi:hypothetical protein [Streptacidiphilus cavernicola]|uniref:Uncharacterized protein n=1 Tax=Streptacidiphilus cavernicola TaxID=3342716 RepID=A0ABV6W460_9ACTN
MTTPDADQPVYIGPLLAEQNTRQVRVRTPGGIPLAQGCSSRREAEELIAAAGQEISLDDDTKVYWVGDRGVWPVGAH